MPEKTGHAASWLTEHARDKVPVFLEREVPDDVLKSLKESGLLVRVPGDIVVIRSPDDDPETVTRALAWSIIEKLTQKYAPALIERDSAVRLFVGQTTPGPEVRMRHAGRSRWRQEIVPGVAVRLEHGPVSDRITLQVGEARIPVETPERVLLTLPLGFLREERNLTDLSLWLKSLVLAKPALEAAYRDAPRPVVLKRISDLARDVGNDRLAALLDDVIMAEQAVRIGRDRTGVGRDLVVPAVVTNMRSTRQPWLDRLRLSIQQSKAQIALVVPTEAPGAAKPELPVLLRRAQASKAYDAYHSSSIEGYRLRFEEVSALLGGVSGEGPGIEDLKGRLAIIGYGTAFDALFVRIAENEGALTLSPALALDLYTDLFTPSVEAGLVDREALRRFRNGPVFIRDTLFTPPNADKVPALLELLFDEVNAIPQTEGYLRACLVHLWFAWVHPFPDGNGRVARFLMNAALLASGEPWLTIRVDQREDYFAALRRAQLSEDYVPFAELVLKSASARPAPAG